MDIKISFNASIEENDIDKLQSFLNNNVRHIIIDQFPMIENVGNFQIETDPLDDNWEE